MLNIDDRLIREVQPKIGPNAMAVLLAIAIHLNQKTNRCFPSHARLMSLTGMGKNPVYDALKVLKTEGILISEQAIDSANKKFGPRVFRLTTRFIKIFVDVEDMEPLPESREPESREPESREPESREPESRETQQINNGEQINYLEQINNSERAHAQNEIPTSKPEKENGVTPPAAAPTGPQIPFEVGTLEHSTELCMRWCQEHPQQALYWCENSGWKGTPQKFKTSILNFFSHYRADAGHAHRVKTSPEDFFKERFAKWLIMEKNMQKPSATPGAPADQPQTYKRPKYVNHE